MGARSPKARLRLESAWHDVSIPLSCSMFHVFHLSSFQFLHISHVFSVFHMFHICFSHASSAEHQRDTKKAQRGSSRSSHGGSAFSFRSPVCAKKKLLFIFPSSSCAYVSCDFMCFQQNTGGTPAEHHWSDGSAARRTCSHSFARTTRTRTRHMVSRL